MCKWYYLDKGGITSMSKEPYKEMFLRAMPYVKFSNVCKECHVSYSAFNAFLNGKYEQAISVEKLETLRQTTLKLISETLEFNPSESENN